MTDQAPTATVPDLDLEALLARWEPYLRGEARGHARRLKLDPDELGAEARLQIVRDFPRFDPRLAGFSTWAKFRVRAAASRLVAGRSRCVRCVEPVATGDRAAPFPEPLVATAPDPRGVSPLDAAARNEARDALAAAIEALPARQREAVRVRFFGAGCGADGRDLEAALAALRARLGPPDGGPP